jgi:hypothetical protein
MEWSLFISRIIPASLLDVDTVLKSQDVISRHITVKHLSLALRIRPMGCWQIMSSTPDARPQQLKHRRRKESQVRMFGSARGKHVTWRDCFTADRGRRRCHIASAVALVSARRVYRRLKENET